VPDGAGEANFLDSPRPLSQSTRRMRAQRLVWLGGTLALASAAWVAEGCNQGVTPSQSLDGGVDSPAPRHDATASHDAIDFDVTLLDGDGAPPPPLEDSPPALIPVDIRVNAVSAPILFDTLRGMVWTANGDVGSVSFVGVDQGAQRLLDEIPVGSDIRSIALSPDDAVLAAVDRVGGFVALLDAQSRTLLRRIPVGSHPRSAVWDATDPRWLYVTVEDLGAVAVIDRTLGVLSKTIPVGRIPAGLAVSGSRPELYVTHRIDSEVTRVSLTSDSVLNNVPLADQPAATPPTVPQGMPFSFDAIAWATDNTTMWVTHELLAPTHPFQFQETLFPAISVVDFSGTGEEVQTDPNDPNGVVAGRKLLFGAIDLLDTSNNVVIVSDPCGVAFHPNGQAAYALACASDDILTFDLTQGIAVSILRNLPGSHPVGLALDETGARAFVLSDQSKTLVTLDLAGGALLGNVSVIDGPLVIAKDTVDTELRAGLTAFYSADSSGTGLTTTGNNWISCQGCHLDGFESQTLRLFESARVVDQADNAQIGHTGLKDLFSTAPTPTSPSFDPHDILVALEEQGGLSPDRTGQNRAGAIDASAPTDAAAILASELARVVARDLPIGPSWLLPQTDAGPNAEDDTAVCGSCHTAEYAAWKTSVHAHAAEDKMVSFCVGTENGVVGAPFTRVCAGCHDPVNARLGDTTFASPRGVTCLGCHEVTRPIRAGGNADLDVLTQDWAVDHKAQAQASLATLETPEFCAGCHEQFVPGTGLGSITTYNEWNAGRYANAAMPTTCVDCHMTPTNGVSDHSFPGGNVYLSTLYGETDLAKAETDNLTLAMRLSAARGDGGGVDVTVTNYASGHSFPTGVTDIVEAWVELQAVDASGNELASYGGPNDAGVLPPTAARFGTDLANADGGLLLEHQLSLAQAISFDRRVPPGGSVVVTVMPPATLPAGATGLEAVLYYHNVRTTYFQAATGSSTASVAPVRMARAPVP
jgi:DNA-binding beta-propeller fold protein YncE